MSQNGNSPIITTSFVQGEKHLSKSDRFKPIQPSQLAEVMDFHGFVLVRLNTGKAKSLERADHQTTIARYRSRDGFEIEGLHFDIVLKVPHLYGALQGYLGILRQVCQNGLIAGTMFNSIKVSHLGDPMGDLNRLIPMLVAQRAQLVEQVKAMKARSVTKQELAELCKRITAIRLQDVNNPLNIQYQDLLQVNRIEDQGSDLFTVLNVLQENVMRYGLRYQSQHQNKQTNEIVVRNMNARPITRKDVETSRSVELNGSIWDAAAELLKVA